MQGEGVLQVVEGEDYGGFGLIINSFMLKNNNVSIK